MHLKREQHSMQTLYSGSSVIPSSSKSQRRPTTMTSYSISHYEQDLLPEIFQEIQKLAKTKGGEYAHGDDRLDNFRRNATNNAVQMETCWSIYAGKHWDAIQTYVRDLQLDITRERSESIKGRALDLMVYLTLF